MFPVPERLPFTFHTHTGSPTGYAETAVVLFHSLVAEGVEVHYVALGDDHIYELPSFDQMVNALRRVEPEGEPIRVLYSIAPMFWSNAGDYKVGFSMIEVDRIPARWVRACNHMDEVWVPTELNKVAFLESGVVVPVWVVPLGIDTWQFRPTHLPMVYHGEHKFRFIAFGWWQLRKRWDLLFKAFADEFGGQKDVGLICKIMSEEGPDSIIDQIHGWVGDRVDDQVAVLHDAFPWWELVGIIRSCHAFVMPTSGEGFGCPPLQALACGLPVITTDCMGVGEALRDAGGKPFSGVTLIPGEKAKCEVQHEYYADGNWWVPDVGELRRAMRDVYENYGRWQKAALAGSAQVRSQRSGEVAARGVMAELERIYRKL